MKIFRFAPLVLFLATSPTFAKDFYLAPDGKDANPGTLEAPFLTFTRAQQTIQPGDTVYIRGGKYNVTSDQIANPRAGNAVHVFEFTKSGTKDAPITYTNYKDEIPVFDFATVKPNARVYAFYVTGNWLRFRGFEVTAIQVTQTGHTQSEAFENHGSNNIYDRLKMHNSMAIGYYALGGSNTLVINCDAWNNWDSVSEGGRGGNADGFGVHVKKGDTDNVFRNCRAWYNSDDGYDAINCAEAVLWDGCWAMYNGLNAEGRSLGDGNGFKAGGYGKPATRVPNPIPRSTIQFCLSVGNKAAGFYANHHTGGQDWISNTAFRNANNFSLLEYSLATNADIPGPNAFMRNNLGYKGRNEVANLDAAKSDILNNYFNLGPDKKPMTFTDADFLSLDEKQLTAPRKPDGSLPDITFMHLAKTNPAIDKGVILKSKDASGKESPQSRFPFTGPAPDLGCFESEK